MGGSLVAVKLILKHSCHLGGGDFSIIHSNCQDKNSHFFSTDKNISLLITDKIFTFDIFYLLSVNYYMTDNCQILIFY